MRKFLFLLASALLASACPTQESAPDATPCSMDVEFGPRRMDDFQAFSNGAKAELVLGFQGFRYISSSVRILAEGAESEKRGSMLFQISLEGQEPYSLRIPFQPAAKEADGWRYGDSLQIFFNDTPVAETVGKNVTIAAKASLGDCVGTYSVNVKIVDEEQCIEQPDGSLLCQ